MNLFQFNQYEMLSFFAVLVRVSVLVVIIPFLGDRFIPGPVKILLALGVTFSMYPGLVSAGHVKPDQAKVWAATTPSLSGTLVCEVLIALLIGYVVKMSFDGIMIGGNLMGTFMGFSMAQTFDPHQETQSQMIADLQMSLAMLMFMALDGHLLVLNLVSKSYEFLAVGKPIFSSGGISQLLIQYFSEAVKLGVLLAAPMAISLFAINIAFGIASRALPQLNVLLLSLGISAWVGMILLMASNAQSLDLMKESFERIPSRVVEILKSARN